MSDYTHTIEIRQDILKDNEQRRNRFFKKLPWSINVAKL